MILLTNAKLLQFVIIKLNCGVLEAFFPVNWAYDLSIDFGINFKSDKRFANFVYR